MLVYGFVKYIGIPHFHPVLPGRIAWAPQAPISTLAPPAPIITLAPAPIIETGIADGAPSGPRLHLGGQRVWGNGDTLNLGDRRTHLPGSLLSRFFPALLTLPSCLTEIPLALPPVQKPLPVRDDWPGFYGAPWAASLDGNLIVLLDVMAPRNPALPAPGSEFQIYPDYHGEPAPAFSAPASARLYRGSKAVLYRVFVNGPAASGPFRCLDLVVQNGENNGIGHLYYQKYHHYYESDARFVIQQ